MRPDEIQRRGAALAERVGTQVDSQERLQIMLRTHRHRRNTAMAVATAAVLAVIVSLFMLVRVDEPPVITVPPSLPSTVAELQSLPVEVYVVLPADYTLDEITGACEGSGSLASIREGSVVRVEDESVAGTGSERPTITLLAGVVVSREDPRSSFLLSGDNSEACVFALRDLGYDIADYDRISLSLPETGANIASGMVIRGQRVIFTFEDSQ